MTDETGLAAALRERYMTAYETGEAGPPDWDENARVARAWVNARLADPATVEAVVRALATHRQEHEPTTGASHCACGDWRGPFTMWTGQGSYAEHTATAALAAVRGLLGVADGEG